MDTKAWARRVVLPAAALALPAGPLASSAHAAYGGTELVSLASNEAQGASASFNPDISDDGRCAAFVTASQLNPRDTNGAYDVFMRDRRTGTTERVSQPTRESVGNGASDQPSISASGRYVAFASNAPLSPDDPTIAEEFLPDVYVRDLVDG